MVRPPRSITEFLTDASLVRLCTTLGQIAHARITVHDEAGRRIDYTGGVPPWSVGPSDEESKRIASSMHEAAEGPRVMAHDGRLVEPLIVSGFVVGAVVIDAEPARHASGEVDALREVVENLIQTVDEFCDHEVTLKHRNAELSVLYRLSSLLATARDVESVLNVALRSAMQVLEAEAGMVHLADEDGKETIRAHANLSSGMVEDLRHTEAGSEAFRSRLEEDGLTGLVSCSLFFSGRTLGAIRLLWRRPMLLEPDETALMQTIAEQVSAAVESARLVEAESHARRVRRQLRLAGEVQRRMLPRVVPTMPRFDIDARCIPTMELGGDFYDLIELNGHLGVLIGDVAGKGVPAALLMAAVRASLRAHAADVYHLDEILARVNKAMANDTLPHEFATIFYGVVDPVSLRLTYCNAGHDPPLLLRRPQGRAAEDRDLYELTAGGMVVGVDPAQTYARGMFDLSPGDTLVCYTDGIVDARNFESKRFGRERLRKAILEVLERDPACTARGVADHIVWEVRRFVGLNTQTDDETLVVVRVRE